MDNAQKMLGFSVPAGGLKKRDEEIDEKKSIKLTETMLDNVIKEEYQHENLTV